MTCLEVRHSRTTTDVGGPSWLVSTGAPTTADTGGCAMFPTPSCSGPVYVSSRPISRKRSTPRSVRTRRPFGGRSLCDLTVLRETWSRATIRG